MPKDRHGCVVRSGSAPLCLPTAVRVLPQRRCAGTDFRHRLPLSSPTSALLRLRSPQRKKKTALEEGGAFMSTVGYTPVQTASCQ
jgi:hypothetical protein